MKSNHQTNLKLILASLMLLGGTSSISAQWARVLTTTGSRTKSLELSSVQANGNSTNDAIILRPSQHNQQIDGFGYALTYSACFNLKRMSNSERTALLTKTFSPTAGYGVSYVRIAIGCCDFSSSDYSLCDSYGDASNPLKNFQLKTDETNYIIPILKEILAINPDLKIIATPWTAPRWMKLNQYSNTSYNSWTGGRLNPSYYATYGEYFVKFIQAMADNGITIYAVSPQNEPLNTGNSASMWMSYDQEADFVKTGLAPAIKQAGLTTKIYLYDHNYNYDNNSDQRHYPILAYNRMGSGFQGEELVVGACYHNYGGTISDIKDDVVWGRTDKELIFTEASIGQWNDGRNLNSRLAYDMDELVISHTLNRFKASLVWNFMLDTNGSPYRPGGCDTCYGAIDLDASNTNSYTFNSHYYIMAHASDAVKPGAYRVDTEGWWTNNLSYAAFQNPDNTTSILLSNQGDSNLTVKVNSNSRTYNFQVPGHSVVSAVMDLATDPTIFSGLTSVETDNSSAPLRLYDLMGRPIEAPLKGALYITSDGRKIRY
jgi:glucosylceramidase